MSNVIELACATERVRTLQNIRQGINERARHIHASDSKRLRAFGLAREVFESGASSAWAVQAGIQTLTGQRVVNCRPAGGAA